MKKMIAIALSSILLVACGKKLDGTYADATNNIQYTFKGDQVEVMGMELEYKVEDGKVKIKGDNGQYLVLKIKDDETLYQPMVGDLTKR